MTANSPPNSPEASLETTAPPTEPAFGWTQYAEQTNGRFAMVGFAALLLLNLLTGQDFFSWIGLH